MAHRPWTRAEIHLIELAPHWGYAAVRLPHRTPHAVQIRWHRIHRLRSELGRRQLDPDARRVAQILTAVFFRAHQERRAVDVEALIEALRDGRWRDIGAGSLLTSPTHGQRGTPR